MNQTGYMKELEIYMERELTNDEMRVAIESHRIGWIHGLTHQRELDKLNKKIRENENKA